MLKLVVIHPFKDFVKGQEITDQNEVSKHLIDRDHHFVRVTMTRDEEDAEKSRQAKRDAPKSDPVAEAPIEAISSSKGK